MKKFEQVYKKIIAEQNSLIEPSQICCHIYGILDDNNRSTIMGPSYGIQIMESGPKLLTEFFPGPVRSIKGKALNWTNNCVPYIMNLLTTKYLVGNTFQEIATNLKQFNIINSNHLNQLYKSPCLGQFLIELTDTDITFSMYNTVIGGIKQGDTPEQIQTEIYNIQQALLCNDNFTPDNDTIAQMMDFLAK